MIPIFLWWTDVRNEFLRHRVAHPSDRKSE